MDNTIIYQGSFTSDETAKLISLRGGVDWIEVFNATKAAAGADIGAGYQFFWQVGMPQGRGFAYSNPAVPIMDQLAAGTGFYYQDTSLAVNTRSAAAVTAISHDNPPRVTSVGHGLITGDIVRLVSTTGALQLDGIDFRVTYRDANTFDLSWMAQVVAANPANASSRFYKISNEGIYVPRQRVITSITQAQQAVVKFSAPHNFTVGQEIRFKIPVVTAVAYGMTEINNLIGTVLAVDLALNTVTVDIDTSGFTAFAFPLTADVAFTPAQCVPVGENTAEANFAGVSPLGDAVENVAEIGMLLQAGKLSPAGENGDVIYWKAGTSFSVDNQ